MDFDFFFFSFFSDHFQWINIFSRFSIAFTTFRCSEFINILFFSRFHSFVMIRLFTVYSHHCVTFNRWNCWWCLVFLYHFRYLLFGCLKPNIIYRCSHSLAGINFFLSFASFEFMGFKWVLYTTNKWHENCVNIASVPVVYAVTGCQITISHRNQRLKPKFQSII